ncbi:MAG: ABC transporter ATP-binding protein [Nitrososphaeria archaeon]|nr:ABC transporter ATP-binding protein [Nitrososphaeria archaeon]
MVLKNEVVVKTENLWKIYKSGQLEYPALRGVSIEILRGEFAAIVGPSGSGKTTLLNLIGTLDSITRGEVYLNGTPVSKMKGNQLANFRNKTLGFVFQTYNLVPYLNVLENVELPLIASNIPRSKRHEKARKILEQLGLGEKLNKMPNELSGGEQQRVAIARALVNDPSLILADEPTGNLDSKTAQVVASILKNVCYSGVTVIMVTHNLEITKLCNRIIYLRDGVVEKEVVQN